MHVILDRDGVINIESAEYVKSPDEWHPIPGSLAAIAALNRAGYQVFVATNQSGVARGYYDVSMLNRIHEKLNQVLAQEGGIIEEIFYCPHHPDDHCHCRKPKPGLIHQIAEKYGINLTQTYFIGDSLVDINAAKAAGCIPLLVLTGNGKKTRHHHEEVKDIPTFDNLKEAVDYVLKKRNQHDTKKI